MKKLRKSDDLLRIFDYITEIILVIAVVFFSCNYFFKGSIDKSARSELNAERYFLDYKNKQLVMEAIRQREMQSL